MRVSGATPLNIAVEAGQKEVADLLLDNGANVNAKFGQLRLTPLHIAASQGNKDLAALLIEHGADVNAKYELIWEKSDWTPLRYAIQNGNIELIQLLIDNGADPDEKDRFGQSMATIAMFDDDRETVDLLLTRGAAATINLAVYVGDIEKTRELLTGEVDINLRVWQDRTLLGIAAQRGHIQVMEELIAHGAEINVKDSNDPEQTTCPALYLAALGDSADAVNLLISNGADINARDDSNSTPLHLAAYKGNREVVEILLANGADINAQGWDYSTPLYLAAKSGHRDIVELLLTKGADVKAGCLGKKLSLADSAVLSQKELIEQIIAVCKPYSIIVSDTKSIQEYLRSNGIDFDDMWIPEQSDIEVIDPVLRSHLSKNIVVGAKEHFDPKLVLRNLHLYNREYSGITRDGARYIICQMIIHDLPEDRPDNAFIMIHGSANGVVRFVFDVQNKTIVKIDCEYIM